MAEYSSHAPGSFSWVELMTSDPKAGVAFYRALFGHPKAAEAFYTSLFGWTAKQARPPR